jgi:SAM-dependent methyltransferase
MSKSTPGAAAPSPNGTPKVAPRSRKTQPALTDTTFLLNRSMISALRQEIEARLPLGWSGRVLDVGCGGKPYASLFEQRCSEYVGCDEYPVDSSVVRCPADRLSFADGEFDLVFCSQVLEHVARPWAVVAECSRVLRPGGVALFTAPFLFPHHASPTDFYRFTHEGLSALAMDAGLEVEDVSAQCGSIATVFLLTNWYVGLVRHVLNRRWLTRPLSWLCSYSVLVPLNLAGMAADRVKYARDYTRGNMGVANYMIIARKPRQAAARPEANGRHAAAGEA